MKGLWYVLCALALVAGLACSDGPMDPAAEPTVLTLPELTLSNAVAAAAVGIAPITAVGTAGGETAAYVSLPTGTLPQMASVLVRNLSADHSAPAAPVVDGGFDPVPIAGEVGDELELTFTEDDGSMSVAYAIIPSESPPTVVRTNPPRGRTDVALSVIVTVVFSEPIDPGTLAEGVKLQSGGADVAASVYLLPDKPWTAELAPAALLQPETVYELQVATEVRDLDGHGLAEPIRVTFTTESEPPAGAIAFVSDRDGTPHIYVADPDGSNVRRLAEGQEPAWSWDGRKIAFVRDGGIYLMDPDGSDPAHVGSGRTPTWAPDGRIAFSLSDSSPPSFGLYAMNADGSGVTELLSPSWLCEYAADCAEGQILWPTWSPDGRSIAFLAYVGSISNRTVGIVNADGSGPRLLQGVSQLQVEGFFQTSSGVNTRAAWSPDGSTIALITGNPWLFASHPYLIYTYEIVPADLELVHTAPGLGVGSAANHPSWSPDGKSIVFDASSWEGDPRGRRRIFTVSPETGEVRQLIPDDAFALAGADYGDWGAVWSRASR